MIDLLLQQDPEPWFSPETANLVGAIGGAGVGLIGGTIGAMCGMMVPKGKGRGVVLPLLLGFAILGGLLLILGIVAVSTGQPYEVWYPLALLGFILAVVFGCLYPGIKRLYAQAEQRQLEADALRRS
ncbi:MAG: hypothetical protein ACYTF3_07755 [Planctomycetota bacterium]|jgi:peptidoglycan/LPS O-acetylase OafA/YrhL